MKTAKYKLEIEFYENQMLSDMTITKKEFLRQLAFMREQIELTKDYECPVTEASWSPQVREHKGVIETVYTFCSGCGRTFLTAFECKPGYHFTK